MSTFTVEHTLKKNIKLERSDNLMTFLQLTWETG
jgi:hypothetical protein